MIVKIRHMFVEYMPEKLEENTLYISIKYATTIHLCPCGCGNKVVAPLSPNDWSLTFDGLSISLSPSIGNWSFPCKSHYWIREDKIVWSRKYSRQEIDEVREEEDRTWDKDLIKKVIGKSKVNDRNRKKKVI
jgi:hypothetical protein